jgi:mono/diheme cytochrome c family protein
LAAFALAGLLPLAGQNAAAKQPVAKPATAKNQPSDDSSRGQQVFKQNCARCHDAPQAFPPQIAGTIIRHMRVRASMSAADEKALLKFMNP